MALAYLTAACADEALIENRRDIQTKETYDETPHDDRGDNVLLPDGRINRSIRD
jgi:hypothetical protein